MNRFFRSVIVPFVLVLTAAACSSSDSADDAASPGQAPAGSSLTLHGGVVDGMTQSPLAGAPLVAADASGTTVANGTTHADGTYSLSIPVAQDGFRGTLTASAPGYWTRRFFAPEKPTLGSPRREQEVTFHMQSDSLIALQGQMLGITIDDAKAIVGMTVQDASGAFVAPDFPAVIDLDVPYARRVYLDAMGRPNLELTSGWFAIFLNVAPGPVTGTAIVDGKPYGTAKVVAKGREMDGSWIRP